MQAFHQMTAITATMLRANIDTDQIIPKNFLKIVSRSGLGDKLFFEQRFTDDNQINSEFVLNAEPYSRAQILLAGENFGCGSSREHAVWALMDFGIRCVIAPSYSDIFSMNCIKNGLLAAQLDAEQLQALGAHLEASSDKQLTVDLAEQTIRHAADVCFHFDISSFAKDRLLQGEDEISMTLREQDQIEAYEQQQQINRPWLSQPGSQLVAVKSL